MLKTLLDYQRFSPNEKLSEQIDSVFICYFSSGQAITDEELELAAAGEPSVFPDEVKGYDEE